VKKILFGHITGAPIIKGSDMGFTEGGLPHILSASTDLTEDYEIEVICPNLPGDSGEQAAVHKGVKIVSLGTSSWVKGYSRMPGPSFYRRAYSYIRKQTLISSSEITFSPPYSFAPYPEGSPRLGSFITSTSPRAQPRQPVRFSQQ